MSAKDASNGAAAATWTPAKAPTRRADQPGPLQDPNAAGGAWWRGEPEYPGYELRAHVTGDGGSRGPWTIWLYCFRESERVPPRLPTVGELADALTALAPDGTVCSLGLVAGIPPGPWGDGGALAIKQTGALPNSAAHRRAILAGARPGGPTILPPPIS